MTNSLLIINKSQNMNSHELAELKFLQFKIEEAKHNYLLFLQSKNYKIRVYDSFEDSLVTAIHRDYLDQEENRSFSFRDWVKEDSPDLGRNYSI